MNQKSSFFRRSTDANSEGNENESTQNSQEEELVEFVPRKRAPRPQTEEDQSPQPDQDDKPRRSPQRDSSPYERSDSSPYERSGSSPYERRDSSPYERSDRPAARYPRSEGTDSRRGYDQRGRGADYGDRKDFSKRPARGERPDFRKPDNRKPDEDREAPENVIYGIHPVKEAIEMGKTIEKVYFRRNSSADDARYDGKRTHSSDAIDMIRDMLVGSDIVSQDVPPEKLDRLSRRGNHQGVVAVVSAIEYVDFNNLLDKLTNADVPPLVVVVDSVTDVRNFGAIARSAECAGADAIIMSAKNSAPVNSEAMRSSAGALSIIPVCRVGSLRNSLKSLQMGGLQLVAATEKTGSILFEADLTKPTVIIMGSEDKGISNEILKMCDAKISIPLLGKVESLNVSAAAAVMLFEAVRQRFMAID